jgi:glutathione synthase
MATDLSKRDRQICAALRPVLRKELLVFVGIDVIDGWLTEINVTSPTGIQEVNRLDALAGPARVEVRVMDAAERRLAERRAPGKA